MHNTTPDPLELEMAYAVQACFDERCKNLLDLESFCTRKTNHEGDHANGWLANGTRRTWPRSKFESTTATHQA